MTVFKYKCSKCGNVFEIEATMQEKEEAVNEKFICPKCVPQNNFASIDQSGGCCSGGNACGVSCKPETSNDDCCSDKNGTGGCCG